MALLPASAETIQSHIELLSTFNATRGDGITRVALSAEDDAARGCVKQMMESLDLEISQDAAGNIFGRLVGAKPELSPVWSGSHIDTVLHGGAYDGMAGVVCALEAVRILQESKVKHERDIVVVVFTAEEPTRFGLGCIGSRALCGDLLWDDAQRITDDDGRSLAEVLKANQEDFAKVAKTPGSVHSFVELHIEQAEQLEQKGAIIGVVHTISAPTEIHMTVLGKQRHAGATPMDIRKDPFPAVAEIALCLEKAAKECRNQSTVATIGKVNLHPNASNVIAGKVTFSIDIRSSRYQDKTLMMKALEETVANLERERGLTITQEILCDDEPTYASAGIVKMIQAACQSHEYPFIDMASGAYHDSMFMAKIAPFSMIFVPSKDGISHDKAEWTDCEDLAKGTDVLADVLYELSNEAGLAGL